MVRLPTVAPPKSGLPDKTQLQRVPVHWPPPVAQQKPAGPAVYTPRPVAPRKTLSAVNAPVPTARAPVQPRAAVHQAVQAKASAPSPGVIQLYCPICRTSGPCPHSKAFSEYSAPIVSYVKGVKDRFHEQHSQAIVSARETFDEGAQRVSAQVDQTMQKLGVSATNVGREMVKFEANPEDWMVTRLKKKAWNFGVDLLADNAVLIARYGNAFIAGVVDKIPRETYDRLNPRHMSMIVAHPDLARLYLHQRKEQILTLYNFYMDPWDVLKKQPAKIKNSFYNLYDRSTELEGYQHGGRVFVDYVQRKIAPVIGASMVMFMIYNARAAERNATRAAFNRMFPAYSLTSPFTRNPLTRILITKPFSRIVGNPALSAAALTYLVLVNMGKSIRDSLELKKQIPVAYQRLRENQTEMYRSGTQLDLQESIRSQSGKNQDSNRS